jgi:hypothetical protein
MEKPVIPTPVAKPAIIDYSALYDSLQLDSLLLSRQAFNFAVQGYKSLESSGELQNNEILSIVDFSLPSDKKRLFVLNMETGKLLFNTWVSHGKNSGRAMATRFSNKINSNQSSLGFYVTGDTYRGGHGYSLRLDGKEEGINDNAMSRGIVMHSAKYVDEDIIQKKGYIGRSLGCPAVPEELYTAIIDSIKSGSCLFLYSPDRNYVSKSKIITQQLAANVSVNNTTGKFRG